MKTACIEFLITFLILNLMCLAISTADASKRACASFGHSCFGGHGKRFEPEVQEMAARIQDNRSIRDANRMRNRDGDQDILASDGEPFSPFASAPNQNFLKALMACQAIKHICDDQTGTLAKVRQSLID